MIIMLMSQEIIHLGIYIHSSLGKVNIDSCQFSI